MQRARMHMYPQVIVIITGNRLRALAVFRIAILLKAFAVFVFKIAFSLCPFAESVLNQSFQGYPFA